MGRLRTRGGEAAATLPRVRTLNFTAPAFGPADGYGNSAEQMTLALEAQGVRISLFGINHFTGSVRAGHIRDRAPERGEAILYYAQPHAWDRRDDVPTYGFTMYESDTLPKKWLERIDNVSEIWVPATWHVDRWQAVTEAPVHVVPLAVNAEDFAPRRRVRGRKLRVLSFSTYAADSRKGTDVAIAAFRSAFAGREDVELVVRSTFQCLFPESDDPRITFCTGQLSTEALAAYYREFDALLFPSRGEGFGLIPLEFMATAGPAIFTNAMGMADYGDLGLSVSSHRMPATVGAGPGCSVSAVPYGFWEEPDLEELVARLREVDRDYERVMEQAEFDAKVIAERWTWERTARAIVDRLKA